VLLTLSGVIFAIIAFAPVYRRRAKRLVR